MLRFSIAWRLVNRAQAAGGVPAAQNDAPVYWSITSLCRQAPPRFKIANPILKLEKALGSSRAELGQLFASAFVNFRIVRRLFDDLSEELDGPVGSIFRQ